MMRLASPAWLALVAVALVLGVVWLGRRRWQRFPFPLGTATGGRRLPAATTVAGLVAALALVPLAVALARPQEVLSRQLERARGVDIVVALDVSESMGALDFQPSNRLEVAKEVIAKFLQRRPDDRFGLVAFAGAAVTLCPLTLDHDVAAQLIDRARLDMLPGGTAIGLGLGTAVNRLRVSDAESKVVVLVTDGSSNAGQLDPVTAAELAASQHVTVHTVLVGEGGRVPIPIIRRDPLTGREVRRIEQLEVEVNPELLAQIARITGGTSFRARDAAGLEKAFDEIDAMERTEFESTKLVRTRERFEPWAAAALLLLVVAVVVETGAGRTPW